MLPVGERSRLLQCAPCRAALALEADAAAAVVLAHERVDLLEGEALGLRHDEEDEAEGDARESPR